MMMMAYPEQPHASHQDPRHYAHSISPPLTTTTQWVPASATPRERLHRSPATFFGAAHSQSFVSAHHHSTFFDQPMSAGAASPASAATHHFTPMRPTLHPSRTLSHDEMNWSHPADDWSITAPDHAAAPLPTPAPTRSMSLPSHGDYQPHFTFGAHDSSQITASWEEDRKLKHADSPWPSAPAPTTDFPADDQPWQFGADEPAPSSQYSPVPHVRGAHFADSPTSYSLPQPHVVPVANSDRAIRKDISTLPILPDVMHSPSSIWHDGEHARFGASPSPVHSATPPTGSPPPMQSAHGTSPSLAHVTRAVRMHDRDDADALGGGPKKKRRRASGRQLDVLNNVYARTAFPSTEERHELARQLEMTPRSVQIWFQNRRQTQRERRPMGTSPLAPNVERLSRREAHSVRTISATTTATMIDSTTHSYISQHGSIAGSSAEGGSSAMAEHILPTADDTQLEARTRGRSKRFH